MNIKIIKYDDTKSNLMLFEMLGVRHKHPALSALVNQFSQKNNNNTKYCLVIKMNLSKIKDLNSVKGGAKYYRNFIQNIKGAYSFINNSSIWIRLVDNDCTAEKIAINEFKYFNEIGLYDYDSAIENLDYNIRLQPQNYLDSKTQGHGVHVTPVLYGDEAESLNILRDNNLKIE